MILYRNDAANSVITDTHITSCSTHIWMENLNCIGQILHTVCSCHKWI